MTAAALKLVHRELSIGSHRKSYVSAFMPVISAAQFIELVNPSLPSHHVFKAGKRVFLVTPASAEPVRPSSTFRRDAPGERRSHLSTFVSSVGQSPSRTSIRSTTSTYLPTWTPSTDAPESSRHTVPRSMPGRPGDRDFPSNAP
ncbi:hypothetical protein [Burkholderia ambifaria]|jgi:hypothetical protein|uniref:hypothetical protein n=1 Tax=Burkholderia ambifaria TaxID=152480 RepID=UPI000AF41623|nr:hypothetical protein [Burkholderia ambifaria]